MLKVVSSLTGLQPARAAAVWWQQRRLLGAGWMVHGVCGSTAVGQRWREEEPTDGSAANRATFMATSLPLSDCT